MKAVSLRRLQAPTELNCAIIPRGGDFFYSDAEFDVMKVDVKLCKDLGCDGVVIGMLNADGTVDKKRCKELVEIAYPLGVTFHRAFDRVSDAAQALEDVADERIIIMPGSGIRAGNIIELAQKTGAVEFHTSARMNIDSKMNYTNEGMNESLKSVSADVDEIKKIIFSLNNFFNAEKKRC